jgi:hypothetical protein
MSFAMVRVDANSHLWYSDCAHALRVVLHRLKSSAFAKWQADACVYGMGRGPGPGTGGFAAWKGKAHVRAGP